MAEVFGHHKVCNIEELTSQRTRQSLAHAQRNPQCLEIRVPRCFRPLYSHVEVRVGRPLSSVANNECLLCVFPLVLGPPVKGINHCVVPTPFIAFGAGADWLFLVGHKVSS